jgi:hypothetical protein
MCEVQRMRSTSDPLYIEFKQKGRRKFRAATIL